MFVGGSGVWVIFFEHIYKINNNSWVELDYSKDNTFIVGESCGFTSSTGYPTSSGSHFYNLHTRSNSPSLENCIIFSNLLVKHDANSFSINSYPIPPDYSFFFPAPVHQLEILGEIVQVENPLVEIIQILPLIIVILVSFLGLRKGLVMLSMLLKAS